ncbi:MAG: hypothetical protein CMH46_10270 [Muricauda sp.]|nr:hypothetical protein [Allomuricauda sp.]
MIVTRKGSIFFLNAPLGFVPSYPGSDQNMLLLGSNLKSNYFRTFASNFAFTIFSFVPKHDNGKCCDPLNIEKKSAYITNWERKH